MPKLAVNPTTLVESAVHAHREANTGAFAASDRWLKKCGTREDALAQAWSLALRAQRWYAQPQHGERPTIESLRRYVGADQEVRYAATVACIEGARHAIVTQDATKLAEWLELATELTVGMEGELAGWLSLGRAWLAVARGDPDTASVAADRAARTASQLGTAPAVIETMVVRALCAELTGDIDEATTRARRAVRMARAEDLPQWQYLASLILARMRRLSGTPHLTSRILRPLLQVAPDPWHGWVAWEALMAGALSLAKQARLTENNDPASEVRTMRSFVRSGVEGDRPSFRQAATALSSRRSDWVSRQHELRDALDSVDAERSVGVLSDRLKPWCTGRGASPPMTVKGLCIDLNTNPGDPGPAAFVVAHPTKAARRIAGVGERVVEASTRIAHVPGKSERTPRTLAAIALGGKTGVSRDDLFKAVYGFQYEHNVHRELFKALIYRVRKTLGPAGKIRAIDEDHYALEPTEVIVIPDPRCEQSLEELMLKALAGMGDPTAQDAAATLGVPLRTAQTALKHLVESGALETERDQNDRRLIRYRVEDTTFSEPTKWS